MKLINLFENDVDIDKIFRDVQEKGIAGDDYDVQHWWREHIHIRSNEGRLFKMYEIGDLTVKDGLMYYKGRHLNLNCDEIAYPIGYAKEINFYGGKLKSVKNFPNKPNVTEKIWAGGQAVSKIDHPIVCHHLSLALNKITTLKDVHKFVKCESITIWNNPIEGPMLGLLMIPGIKTIDDGDNGELQARFQKPNDALKIISKYAGKGKPGVLEAQQE